MSTVKLILLVIAAAIAGCITTGMYGMGTTTKVMFACVILAGCVLYKRKTLKGSLMVLLLAAVFLLCGAALGFLPPVFTELAISASRTAIRPDGDLSIEVTTKTGFFIPTMGCPDIDASDMGMFAQEKDASGNIHGGTYDASLLFYNTVKVKDSRGEVLPLRKSYAHALEESSCNMPYSLWPDVTIKETLDVSKMYDLSHPDTYSVQVQMGRLQSNTITVIVAK